MLDSVRGFIARKTSGNINVHTLDDAFVTELLETHTTRQSVDTYTLDPDISVNVRTVDLHADHKCKVDGFTLKKTPVNVNGFRVKRFTKHDVKTHGLPKRKKLTIWTATKKIQSLPIELENKLRFQKNRPAFPKNEAVLAWYWPIVQDAVIKLALNNQRGTLLVWYNPQSRHGKAKGAYLIRRLGLGEKPELRWV
ncbi:MAG: hypothetical protein IJU26_07325 [Synergistaceae bacterium]|nr:hypothetical protein [Synergistaceae bacterium]